VRASGKNNVDSLRERERENVKGKNIRRGEKRQRARETRMGKKEREGGKGKVR